MKMQKSKRVLSLVLSIAMCFSLVITAPFHVSAAPVGEGFALVSDGAAADIFVDAADFPGIKHAAENLTNDVKLVTGIQPTLKDSAAGLGSLAIIAGSIGNSPVIDGLIASGKLDVSQIVGKWECFTIAYVENPVAGVDGALVIAGSDKRGTIYGIYTISDMIGASAWTFFADAVPAHQDDLILSTDTIVSKEPSVKYRGIFINDEQQTMEWLHWLLEVDYGNVVSGVGSDKTPTLEKGFTMNPKGVAGFNHNYYQHLFDVILRLKGNYMWPAMWNTAFFSDDPENGRLANERGVVLGMSHHEFMSRPDKEWNWESAKLPGAPSGGLTWAYQDTDPTASPNVGFNTREEIEKFWRSGVKERANYEQVVNLGLRGQNDTPALSGGSMAEQIKLLRDVITAQYGIIEDVAAELSAAEEPYIDNAKSVVLYNEVDRFYYAGWDKYVPDDVITVLAGDQHGHVRTLPVDSDRLSKEEGGNARTGGFGMYYHIDFNGGPKSNRWVSTMTLEKMQEQMTMAYDYGVQTLWVVNVGNMKFYETPVEFWFNLAYDIETYRQPDAPAKFYETFAAREFGAEYAKEIAEVIFDYTHFNHLHAPEWIMPHTYSVYYFDEGQRMLARAEAWMEKIDAVKEHIPAERQLPFYEMVWYPAWGTYNALKMMVSTALNQKYAALGLPIANDLATVARAALEADNEAMRYWATVKDTKWKGFFPVNPPSNTTIIPNGIRSDNNIYHLGMTSWNHPMVQFAFSTSSSNTTNLKSVTATEGSELIVIPQWVLGKPAAADASAKSGSIKLPAFSNVGNETRYFEVGNTKTTDFDFTAVANEPWIVLDKTAGTVSGLAKVNVNIDWSLIPAETAAATGTITVAGAEGTVTVLVTANVENAEFLSELPDKTFIETTDGYISILSENYAANVAAPNGAKWTKLDRLGREQSALKVVPSQIDDAARIPGVDAPYLEYNVYLKTPGKIDIVTQWTPSNGTNPYYYTRMRYGISLGVAPAGADDVQSIQTMSPVYMPQNTNGATFHNGVTSATHTVSSNDFSVCYSAHTVYEPGLYTIRIYQIDDGLVLQKILVGTEALTDRVTSTSSVGQHTGVLRCDPVTRYIFRDNPADPEVPELVTEQSGHRVVGASSVPRIFIAPNSATQTANANSPTHLGPPQTPFVTATTVNIRADAVTQEHDDVEYTVSIANAKDIMNATITFEVDGEMLYGKGLEVLLEDFTALVLDETGAPPTIRWTPKEDDIWQGEVVLLYLGGADGFSSEAEEDLFKAIYGAKKYGDASMTITGVRLAGLDEDGIGIFLDGSIGVAKATTSYLKYYSPYDLNKDEVIDERDLAMAQRYYGAAKGDANWAAASVCDFNRDNKVDLLDLIDLFIHFTR